jgi:O-antigen/teichoic acid export membrane protein
VGAGKKPGKHGYSLLLKDSVIYGAGSTLQKFLMVFLMPLYTAYLTPADYGVVGMVNVTAQFIYVFINLGYDVTMSRFYFDDRSEQRRRQVIGTVFLAWTVYPAILLGLLIALMPKLTPLLMGPGDYALYFDLGMLNIFFTNWNSIPFMLMRLDHKPWLFTAFMIARVVIQVSLSVLLVVVLHWGIYGVLVGTLVASFVMNTASLPTYWRRITFRLDPKLWWAMTAFAFPALLNGAIFFVLKLSDRWFLMRYWGKTEVGLYTTAFQLSQPVYVAAAAFRMAWPQWHYAKLNDPAEHKKLVARSSTYFMVLSAILLVGMGVYMPLIVRVLLHKASYWSVGPTTEVLALSTVVFGFYFVLWTGCNVAKKNRQIPLITVLASALNLGLNFLLIPKYGMWAAAWTTVAGFVLLCVLVYFISQRHYPIAFEWGRLVKLTAATATTLAAGYGVAWLLGTDVAMPFDALVVNQLVTTPVLLLFPLVLLATRFFTPGEKAAAVSRWERLRGRAVAVKPILGAASAEHPADHLSADDIAAEQEELEIEEETKLQVSEGDQTGV